MSLEPFVTRDEAIALALTRYGKPITASEAELHVSAEALYWIVSLTGTELWSNDNTRPTHASYCIDAHTGANFREFVL